MPLVKFQRAQREKHTKSGRPYGDLIRRSHCGLWKVVRREWVLPVAGVSYELHLLDADGNVIWSEKDLDTLKDAREGADDITQNAREHFGEDSKEALRIEAVHGVTEAICTVDMDRNSHYVGNFLDGVYYAVAEGADGWYMSAIVDCDTASFADSLVTDDGPYEDEKAALAAGQNAAFDWCASNGVAVQGHET